MSSRLLLQGQLHRPRYEGGAPVKCFIIAECTERLLEGVHRPIPYEPSILSPCSRAASAGGGGTMSASSSSSITITRMLSQVVGTCTIDTSRIACPRGTFGDDVLGAGVAHSAAVLGADGHLGDGTSNKGAGGGLWGLFRWGAKAATPSNALAQTPTGSSSCAATPRGGSLPPTPNAAAGMHNGDEIHPSLSPLAAGGGAGPHKNEETHTIFSTSVVELATGVRLRAGESCTAVMRCDLPPNLPPTFAGYCARYTYAVLVSCEYEVRGRRLSASLRIPLRVDSHNATSVIIRSPYVPTLLNTGGARYAVSGGVGAPAVSSPMSRRGSQAPPSASHDELGGVIISDAFDFKLQSTFSVSGATDVLKPSPVLAPPTDDALFCDDGHLAEAMRSVSRNSAAGGTTPSRAAPRPYELGILTPSIGASGGSNAPPSNGAPSPSSFSSPSPSCIVISGGDAGAATQQFQVKVMLWDTAVRLGDQVRGMFRCTLPPQGPAENPLVCVRAVMTLESIEAAPRNFFKAGSIIPKESQDEASYVVAHCSTIEESEHYLSFSTMQHPFTIPLTSARCQQSSRTDIVSNQWRLRIVFYFAPLAYVLGAASCHGEASYIPIVEKLQEAVIPLTVLPPLPSARMGAIINGDAPAE